MRKSSAGRRSAFVGCAITLCLLAANTAFAAESIRLASNEFVIPKAVTPAVRAACEGDVRRLCVRKDSTADTVKSCVYANFVRFNAKCQRLALQSGLSP
jgi:glutamate racemase